MIKDDVVCEEHRYDPTSLREVVAEIPSEEDAIDSAEIFSQLGNSTRLRILCALAVGDICVCELADLLGISQPAVSHHLRLLRQSGIVRYTKQGERSSIPLQRYAGRGSWQVKSLKIF